jgi:phosphoglycolate phosphatase
VNKSKALVLFDIDGTLMRGAGVYHKNALIDGIRRATGIETHLDGVATAGGLDRDLIVSMLRAAGRRGRFTQTELHRIMEECENAYTTNCTIDLSPFLCNGVRELASELKRQSAVLGLVTGNLSRIGWKKVELAGLQNWFSVGAFSADGTTRARLARVAAQRAKKEGLITADCRITLIGDHINDVAAARANGFQSVAVATGVTGWEELQASKPDYLVRDLRELPPETVL